MCYRHYNFALDFLSKLCLSEKFSDVSFKCGEQSIPAHKTILAASSPFFENELFSEANKEKTEFHFDCKPEIFEYVLRYIYTDLLSNLCLNEKFSDVHFKCGDHSVPAHKTILAASSPFFEDALLSEENKEKTEINLDCKPEVFEYVLRYIYTGKMNVEDLSDNDVIGLFTLIQKMQLPRLLNAVTKRMNTIEMSVENVGLMYEPAVETKSNI
ncbi:BTB/POZ domain-containing protein 9-like protein, partial [Leptotrombidium deliense]